MQINRLIVILIACFSFFHINAAEPPNVLHIVVDDLGVVDVGFMGDARYETPNIDQLASEGIVFTNGYAPAANCAPSRASVLTGQQPMSHGVYTVNSSERGDDATRKLIPVPNTKFVDDEFVLLTEVFQDEGYLTCQIGKWHIGEDPTTQGVDINIAGNHRGSPNTYFSPYGNPFLEDGAEGEYLTDRLTDEAIRFLEKHRDERFFLYLPYFTVHTPLEGKAHLVAKYEDREGVNPLYAAMVECLDDNIGRLMEALDNLGLADDTIVVFTSDNGGIRKFSPQDPYRAGKGSYYEGGIRVPLVIRWPGVIEPDSTSDVPVTGLDFYPTYLDVLGLDAEGRALDGVNLMPLLSGKGTIDDRALYWHFPIYLQAYDPATDDGRDPLFRTRPGTAMRYGKWKLHEYYEDGAYELYNLEEDIGETNNLADEKPEKLAELKAKLDAWKTANNAPEPTEPNPLYDPSKDIWQPNPEGVGSTIDAAPEGGTLYLASDLLKSKAPSVMLSGDPVATGDCPFGTAVLFDGFDDQIYIKETPLKGMNRFTVEVLLRPDAGGTLEPRFLHIGEVSKDRIMLEGRLTDSGEWALDSYLRAGKEWLVLLDREMLHPVGEWAHVALVVEDGHAKNYVNGKFELEGELPFDPVDTGVVSIGARSNRKHWFKGAIYSVRITPKALEPKDFTPVGGKP